MKGSTLIHQYVALNPDPFVASETSYTELQITGMPVLVPVVRHQLT